MVPPGTGPLKTRPRGLDPPSARAAVAVSPFPAIHAQSEIVARAARPVDVRVRVAIVVANAAVLAFIGCRAVSLAPRGCIAMRPHAAKRVLLASSLLASSTGCSYAFVRGPPALATAPVETAPECTTSNAAPVLDTVMASTLILLGSAVVVGGISTGSCSGDCYFKSSEGAIIGVGAGILALGGVYVASASTGYGRVTDCQRLQQAPAPPHPAARYLLDLDALAHASVDSR